MARDASTGVPKQRSNLHKVYPVPRQTDMVLSDYTGNILSNIAWLMIFVDTVNFPS